jgi:hypothetical protein
VRSARSRAAPRRSSRSASQLRSASRS